MSRDGYLFGTPAALLGGSGEEPFWLLWPFHRERRNTVDSRISLPPNAEALTVSSPPGGILT